MGDKTKEKNEGWKERKKEEGREESLVSSTFQFFSSASPSKPPLHLHGTRGSNPTSGVGGTYSLSCPLNVPMSRNPPFNLFQQILKIHTETFTCPIKYPESYQLAVLPTSRPWIPIWVQTAKRQKDRGWGMSNMKTKPKVFRESYCLDSSALMSLMEIIKPWRILSLMYSQQQYER